EHWQIEVQTADITAHLVQTPQTPLHRNWLLTRDIDYTIVQSLLNETRGSLQLGGQEYPFEGYGYCEHNWGVQPRHSTAHWLHFWASGMAGVVMDCHYDAGVPHHYTYLWQAEEGRYLASPAHFGFDPAQPGSTWRVASPDMNLMVKPLYVHRNRMRIPPVFSYIDIDYHELLVEVDGWARVSGERVDIRGVGKYDHNFNRW
ncbi:MAG: hypothetical protein JW850_07410, partial [Thermoflexales bacterium]|nr:hypothetical protein [Thermoflexales bacterium]